MRHRLITALDHVAHFLYCPTMLGRRSARARRHHRLHLIPGRWLAAACDAYDRSLGVTEEELTLRRPGDTLPLACPDGCTRVDANGAVLRGGRGACGQPLGPASRTGSSLDDGRTG